MQRKLSELELDGVYTQLCKTMTAIGEDRARLFLARFALLSMCTIGEAGVIERLINDAAADLEALSEQGSSVGIP